MLSTGCVDGILIFLNRLAAATPMMGYHNDDLDESYLNALLKLCLPLKVMLLKLNIIALTLKLLLSLPKSSSVVEIGRNVTGTYRYITSVGVSRGYTDHHQGRGHP